MQPARPFGIGRCSWSIPCAASSKSACSTATEFSQIPAPASFQRASGPIRLLGVLAPSGVLASRMVAVAQLVRAPDCGSGGCGFNPRQPLLQYSDYVNGALVPM